MQVALLALLIAALWFALKRGGPRTRALRFVRVLFPSFRFFDEAPDGLVLLVRVGSDASSLGGFEESLAPEPLGVSSLWFNAQGNLRLAYHALLEQLVADLGELAPQDEQSAHELVSYGLVERLAREVARNTRARGVFQFKIELLRGKTREELVTSTYHGIA